MSVKRLTNLCWTKMAISPRTLREATGGAQSAPVPPSAERSISVRQWAVRWGGWCSRAPKVAGRSRPPRPLARGRYMLNGCLFVDCVHVCSGCVWAHTDICGPRVGFPHAKGFYCMRARATCGCGGGVPCPGWCGVAPDTPHAFVRKGPRLGVARVSWQVQEVRWHDLNSIV